MNFLPSRISRGTWIHTILFKWRPHFNQADLSSWKTFSFIRGEWVATGPLHAGRGCLPDRLLHHGPSQLRRRRLQLRIQLRRARQTEDIQVILVGNKSDLVRAGKCLYQVRGAMPVPYEMSLLSPLHFASNGCSFRSWNQGLTKMPRGVSAKWSSL